MTDASKYQVGCYPVDKLRFSFCLPKEADTIENAVSAYLDAGYRTADIMSKGQALVGCRQCGQLIIRLSGILERRKASASFRRRYLSKNTH